MRRSLTAILVVFVISIAPVYAQVADPAGEWTGEISVPGSPLGIEVVLTEEAGEWSGTIAIPAQNLQDFALSGVEVEGHSVTFRMEGIPGTPTFDGTMTEDGQRIEGAFSQGGMDITFHLTRADAAREEAAAATQEALDGFGDFVQAAMDSLAVPGAAVAIVRDGEVVFMEGFGHRDVATGQPVTPQTQFAIGSSTKAFTAAALGSLVDEGAITWDTPVVDVMPAFRLADPVATAQMNPVDLLTHRSGLPRHDLLWYAGDFDREELFSRLRHLEPTEPFRAQWQYQNLMYLVAGMLTAELAGQEWEDVVRERLFAPLGMSGANFSVDVMQQQADFARPYAGDRDSIEVMDFRRIDTIGPAGSINASAEEMVRWLLFNLGEGTVDGREIMQSGTVRFLHAPQVVISGSGASRDTPYVMYGLGWIVEPYRGNRMVHHGGNIDGFSALVGFLPDEKTGIVILTNKNGSALPRVIMMSAFDRLLGHDARDWLQEVIGAGSLAAEAETEEIDRIEGTTPSQPLSEFIGTFNHPGYGELQVTAVGDGLRFDYYSFGGVLEHVHYNTFEFTPETIPVTVRLNFLTDIQGRISRVEVPLEMSSEMVVFERLPDEALTSPEYLADFVGTYQGGGLTFTVAMRGQRTLTVSVTGQGTWELTPTREDAFDIDGLSGFRLRFEREDDRVVRLIGIQPTITFAAERVED